MKKPLYWTFAFSLLILFTLTITGFLPNILIENAYASAIKQVGVNNNHKYIVVSPPALDNDSSLPKKLEILIERDVVCEISNAQYDGLSEIYDVSTAKHNVDGQDITLVQLSGNKASVGQVYSYLQANSKNPLRCVPVKYNKYIYLLLSAHVS